MYPEFRQQCLGVHEPNNSRVCVTTFQLHVVGINYHVNLTRLYNTITAIRHASSVNHIRTCTCGCRASQVAGGCTRPRQIAASVVITGIAGVRYNCVVVVRGLVRRF